MRHTVARVPHDEQGQYGLGRHVQGERVERFEEKNNAAQASEGPELIYRPGQAVAISYTVHDSLPVFAFFCLLAIRLAAASSARSSAAALSARAS